MSVKTLLCTISPLPILLPSKSAKRTYAREDRGIFTDFTDVTDG
jgi:hypothetical protein